MKITDIFYNVLYEGYSEGQTNRLIKRFKTENPELKDDEIKKQIEIFFNISQSPKVTQKDLNKYSWKELISTNIQFGNKDTKAGTLQSKPVDANLLYNNNGIRIYVGRSKRACLKYGNGYNFCISSRGERNMYDFYRHEQYGTPYFIFNDNKSKEMSGAKKFIDPDHLLVLIINDRQSASSEPNQQNRYYYTVTNANNPGEIEFQNIESVVQKYNWLRGLEHFFVVNDPDEIERKIYEIERDFDSNVMKLNMDYVDELEYSNRPTLKSYNNEYLPLKNGLKKQITSKIDLSEVDKEKFIQDNLSKIIKKLKTKLTETKPEEEDQDFENTLSVKKLDFSQLLRFITGTLEYVLTKDVPMNKHINSWSLDNLVDVSSSYLDKIKKKMIKITETYLSERIQVKTTNKLQKIVSEIISEMINEFIVFIDTTDITLKKNEKHIDYLKKMDELVQKKETKINQLRGINI